MEFTKEISFDEKLTADKVAKINYHGKLLDTNSDQISIVYGFGQNWDYTSEKAMEKTDNGYEVEVPMKAYDTFNFCFKDGNNNWDNNSQFNYISPIEKCDSNSSGMGSGGDKKGDKEEVVEESKTDFTDWNTSDEDDVASNVELADIEAELTRIFDELFSTTAEEEPSNVQLAKREVAPEPASEELPEPAEEEHDEGEISDIEEIFNILFKKAGYDMDYQTYKAEMLKIQDAQDKVAKAFDELFENEEVEKKYEQSPVEDTETQQEDLSTQTSTKEFVDEPKASAEELDNLVEEILKPLEEQHDQSDEVTNASQEISTVDDFDGIDVKNIELEDINNFEIDDSTKDELQALIEEIDSQIALFEENDDKEDDARSVEDGISNIEETIQVPELKELRFSEESTDEDADDINTQSDINVDIEQLFDYLKKYDEEDKGETEETEQIESSDVGVEEKLSTFGELDDFQDTVEEKHDEEVGNDVKLATTQQEEKEDDEQSIFEKVKEQKLEKVEETQDIAVSSRKLRNFYRITKKIKLAFIKIFYGIPKMLGKKSSSNSDE